MANVYAIKTGNWNDPTLWNTGALPTSADDVFSNTYTVTIDQDVTVLSIRNTAATGITAGGSFTCSTSQTINATSGGLIMGTANLLTYNSLSGITLTINALINNSTITNGGLTAVVFNGIGTLNVNGDLIPWLTAQSSQRRCIDLNDAGTLNIVGNLRSGYASPALRIQGANSTTNITGNVGDVIVNSNLTNAQNVTLTVAQPCTVNITGNIYGGGGATNGVMQISAPATVNITGNVFGGQQSGWGINTTAPGYLSIIGILHAHRQTPYETPAVVSTNSSAINLFSGPFICGPYGTFPYQVVRMHLIPSASSYIEFRDETTNGAISPGAIAPATRMISPSAASDAPSVSNVRFGTVYALGSQTGTVRIPHPNQVSYGVPVDNTFGTAVLTPQAVWDHLISNINVEDSIGERLKNVSTVQTTGNQISSLL